MGFDAEPRDLQNQLVRGQIGSYRLFLLGELILESVDKVLLSDEGLTWEFKGSCRRSVFVGPDTRLDVQRKADWTGEDVGLSHQVAGLAMDETKSGIGMSHVRGVKRL